MHYVTGIQDVVRLNLGPSDQDLHCLPTWISIKIENVHQTALKFEMDSSN